MTRRGRVAIARDLQADLSSSLRALAKQSGATKKDWMLGHKSLVKLDIAELKKAYAG
jgi:hypothetical protein